MAVPVRVSERFYKQLLKAREILSEFLGRDVTFPEITDKIILKVLIVNKSRSKKEIFADWEIKPIVIVVTGYRKYANKRGKLEIEKILNFAPQVEKLW